MTAVMENALKGIAGRVIKAGFLLGLVLISTVVRAGDHDSRLYGTWRVTTYVIDGKSHPVDGLMIITPDYFMANTIFDLDKDGVPEANANSGPYVIEDNKIVLNQKMQLHWRPKNGAENFLRREIPEEIPYHFQDDKLVFRFPSGNGYLSTRIGGNIPE